MTAKNRRLLQILILSSGIGLVAVAAMMYLTWPANTLGNYIRDRQNRQANVRALEWRIGQETDPQARAFYQAWLAEEKGDFDAAISGFSALRDATPPGTRLHLRSCLRLGMAYGQNHQPERELATYQAMMDQYPGQSRLSQATFHLRRGNRELARKVLDEALALDEKDGSLGTGRQFARHLRAIVESRDHAAPPVPR